MPPASQILVRLKEATRKHHETIEAAVPLLRPGLSLNDYGTYLARLLPFYRATESAVTLWSGMLPATLALEERRKAALIERDLRHLGVWSASVVDCVLPPYSRIEQVWGCLYVLEGATLGAKMISRHLNVSLGISQHTGGAFFAGYGERTGTMWMNFGVAITAFAQSAANAEAIIEGAKDTFTGLTAWLQKGMSECTS